MMRPHSTLADLITWWAGYPFQVSELSVDVLPRTFESRDGRRVCVVSAVLSNYVCGDVVRLQSGTAVELNRLVGATRRFQAWTFSNRQGGR